MSLNRLACRIGLAIAGCLSILKLSVAASSPGRAFNFLRGQGMAWPLT
jgi:hypothetical protein